VEAPVSKAQVSRIEAVGDVLQKVIRVNGETYRIRLEPDLDEGGYVVHCETPPGCTSQGDTVEEALAMIADAISLTVATYREKGWPVAPE
jgi:predicted RNase H-like HicB family nuclease